MNEEVSRLLRQTANRFSRKWRVDREDIEQELWIWVLTKLDYSFIEEYANADDYDGVVEYVDKLKQFKASVNWAAERYCRKEKAEREGYSPEDEYFYGLKYLAELLVTYFHVGIEAHPPRGRSESVHRTTDPSEGGGHLASMLDIQKGLAGLSPLYRQRLELRFGPLADMSDDQVGDLPQSAIVDLMDMHPETFQKIMGTTGDQVRHRTDTALKSLQKQLGGSSPWRDRAA